MIAGQIPPPIGGQNICVRRLLELLRAEPGLVCEHLRFGFTRQWSSARKFTFPKLGELGQVVARLLRLRAKGRIDGLVYPIGGPHYGAIARDLLLLPWVRGCSDRVLLHFHAAGIAEKLQISPPWLRWMVARGYQRLVDEALVLTEFGRRDAEALGIKKILVLPNAVPASEAAVPDREPPASPVLLSVGHLCRDKGTPELLQAFSRVASRHTEVRLMLVGEPIFPYTTALLEADIRATGCAVRIEWRGMQDGAELAEAYQCADLFVFSSVAPYESFGLVMVEAMQWKLPLVITDWRANRSVATSSFGGVVAEKPQGRLADSLEEAIEEALSHSDQWPQWGIENRRIYEARYHFDSYRERVLGLFMEKEGEGTATG
ncbi:hypothetical protein Hsar01_02891 [Haloferula sargassicola]|uniref:Glycosyl transferase family 1 domain-containing protein n=1 Tax=Haloferula sargassicola TaxID=490096 RepID=A0ABP9UQE5_9BACT